MKNNPYHHRSKICLILAIALGVVGCDTYDDVQGSSDSWRGDGHAERSVETDERKLEHKSELQNLSGAKTESNDSMTAVDSDDGRRAGQEQGGDVDMEKDEAEKVQSSQKPSDDDIEVGDVANSLAEVEQPFRVCIISHETDAMRHFSDATVENHRRYARRHGYAYQMYHGLVAEGRFMNPEHTNPIFRFGLYWQSVAALEHTLARTLGSTGQPLCERVMWIDADAIFTDPDMRVEQMLDLNRVGDSLQEGDTIKDIVLSGQDNYHGVNSGVLVLRNTKRSRTFVAEVASSFAQFADNPCPEQEAMSELVLCPKHNGSTSMRRAPRFDDVALLEQGRMNALAGNPWGPFSEPGNDSLWQEGSFIAHFHGPKDSQSHSWRVELMHQMAARY